MWPGLKEREGCPFSPFFFIFRQFSAQLMPKNRLAASLYGWRAPSVGNPGSATAYRCIFFVLSAMFDVFYLKRRQRHKAKWGSFFQFQMLILQSVKEARFSSRNNLTSAQDSVGFNGDALDTSPAIVCLRAQSFSLIFLCYFILLSGPVISE